MENLQVVKQRFGIIGNDTLLNRALEKSIRVSPTDISVLVTGESGVGKESIPKIIHQLSHRKHAKYIAVNCGAIPEGTIDSELFGHEKGAFTGAIRTKMGRFELADGGTLFLDEIGDIPMSMQVKLLRVLQEQEFERVGGESPIKVDVRIVSATNKNLETEVAEGRFREDLFYRLHIIPMTLPPLRERRDDIPLLVNHFIEKLAPKTNADIRGIADDALGRFMAYSWPGNVRELENCMHRSFLMAMDGTILPEHLGLEGFSAHAQQTTKQIHVDTHLGDVQAGMSIRNMERALIEQTLEHVQNNRTEAAKLLGISIRTLRNKLKEYQTNNIAIAA